MVMLFCIPSGMCESSSCSTSLPILFALFNVRHLSEYIGASHCGSNFLLRMINNVENPFMCLLTIHITSSVNFLFKFSAH